MKKVLVVLLLLGAVFAMSKIAVSIPEVRPRAIPRIGIEHNYKKPPFASASPRWTVGNIFYDYDLATGRVWMGAMADAQSIDPLVAVSFDGPVVNHPGPTSTNTGTLIAGVKVSFPVNSLVKIGDGEFYLSLYILNEVDPRNTEFVELKKVAGQDLGQIDTTVLYPLVVKNPEQYKNVEFRVKSNAPLPAGKYYPRAWLTFKAWDGGTYLLGNGVKFEYLYLDQEAK